MKKTVKRLTALLLTALLLCLQCLSLCADGGVTEDIVFLVDCSGSMQSEDAEHSAAAMYLDYLDGCDRELTRVGLVCFTNYLEYNSETLFSLTEENGAQAAAAAAGQIRYGNNDTDVALGLREAARLLENSDAARRTVVLIGDGVTDLPKGPRTEAESLKEQAELLDKLSGMGVCVHGVCMNANGNANPDAIREIAERTGGAVFEVRRAAEVEGVLDVILGKSIGTEQTLPSVPGPEKGRFYALFGELLELYQVIETNGELQTFENRFSPEQLNMPEPEVMIPAANTDASAPVISTGSTDGNLIQQTLDTLTGITKQIGDLHEAVQNANGGDLSALEGISTQGTEQQDGIVPEGAQAGAPLPAAAMPLYAAENGDFYLVLHSDASLRDLKLFQAGEEEHTRYNETDAFFDLGDGYRAVRLSQLPAGWSQEPVYLELRGDAGQTVELMLLNLNAVNAMLVAEHGVIKPNETQIVTGCVTARNAFSSALTEAASFTLTLHSKETGESRELEGEPTWKGYAYTVSWPTETHLTVEMQITIACGELSLDRTLSLDCAVCENPITARNDRTKYFLLLCGMKGTGGLAKTFRLEDLVENGVGRVLDAQLSLAGDTVQYQVDRAAGTIRISSLRSFAHSKFLIVINDGFGTVMIPCECFSVPLLLAISVLVLLLGIVGLCILASYMKKHTKFIGKLFLKFRLPPEMSELAIQDSELIFPYTSSISLWELIVVNSSMHDAMTPILQSSDLERVAKSIRIQSWGKNEIRIKTAGLEDVLPQSEAGNGKNPVITMGEDDSLELSVPAGESRMSVTVYRNPNAVKQSARTFVETKKTQTLDEKTESARQILSAISEEVADTAAKRQEAEADSFGTQESINCFVFANMLGMLKLDKDQNTVKLYRDAVDFSPVTLIEAGMLDSNLYYDVYRSFCRKLDRQRRESLGTQMRELLAACAEDRDKAERVEKQTRSMLLSYTAMMRGVMDISEEPTRSAEESAQAAAFYGKVVDVCKQLLGKLEA